MLVDLYIYYRGQPNSIQGLEYKFSDIKLDSKNPKETTGPKLPRGFFNKSNIKAPSIATKQILNTPNVNHQIKG